MQELPIDAVIPELLRELAKAPRVVLEAPPGAGKTTRVPRALLDSGFVQGEVIVTEPRRLAARLAASRVAREHGERLGDRVGYRVRLDEAVSAATRLVYVTEGILLRRMLSEPRLPGVGAVVLDEFHERHLETDLLLSLLARLTEASGAPKLIVMSATLDAEPVARFLGNCARVRSEGRIFPVEIEHLPEPDERPLEKQVTSAVRRIFREGSAGDVLVFLPGTAEIERSERALEPLVSELALDVTPLYGDLSIEAQTRAIQPGKQRKVVLATNIAESSVTIEGVSAVVDSGLVRRAGHSPWTGLPTLAIAKVSRASAIQRAGRAGRTREGRVLRLFTRGDFLSRPEFDVPEVERSDLTEPLLLLHGLGVHAETLSWLTLPPEAARRAASELLQALGAIEEGSAQLTDIGRRLLELPVHPRLGRILVEAERRGVAEAATALVALLGERDIRMAQRGPRGAQRSRDLASGPSDLLELGDAFELARELDFEPRRLSAHELDARVARSVQRAEAQLRRVLRSRAPRARAQSGETLEGADRESALLIATLTGFVDRLARRKKPGGRELILANGTSAKLSEGSVVREGDLLVAVDVEERSGVGLFSETSVRIASSVRAEWLLDLYGERISLTDELVWNEHAERVEQVSRMSFGAVVLEESRTPASSSPEAARVLLRAVEKHGALEFTKSDALSELGERVALLRTHWPDAELPELDAAHALEAAAEYATSFAELRKLELPELLLARLTPEQRRLLERETPERLVLPNSRSAKIHYEPGRPPWVESRLQDFFGLPDAPRLCRGKVPLTLHLLAPNQRAVQVTTDLPGFWARHYPGIRKELMRRYPRHAWPEDGASAAPVKAPARRS